MTFNRPQRIQIMKELGLRLLDHNEKYLTAREKAYYENAWFTPDNIDQSIDAICNCFLQESLLTEWMKQYEEPKESKKIGLIMAGNIPLVGFHDFLTVFMSGHKAIIKLSSKDEKLFRFVLDELLSIDPKVEETFELVERLKDFDAVIATGSNNTSRYFDYYFGKYPNIIRKNRNGTGVLTGDETEEQLRTIGRDIFDYFGLGCRNITKIYVPETYEFDLLLRVLDEYKALSMHHKYKNNYDYNYALYLLNKEKFLANENLILREDPAYISRISCVHYEYYKNLNDLKERLNLDGELIQCICTKDGQILGSENEFAFGASQIPALGEYADGVDTMAFLSNLK